MRKPLTRDTYLNPSPKWWPGQVDQSYNFDNLPFRTGLTSKSENYSTVFYFTLLFEKSSSQKRLTVKNHKIQFWELMKLVCDHSENEVPLLMGVPLKTF